VDVDIPTLDVSHQLDPAVDQIDDITVLADRHPVLVDSGLDRQPGVGAQVPPLTVHRQEVARLHDVQQVEELASGRVTGDVHSNHVLVHDEGAGPGQLVDDPVDAGFVARDQRGGQHHGVARADVDVPVVAGRHPPE